MLTTAVITGAAPAWIGERLAGPEFTAAVVHAGSDAIYLQSRGDVIGIVSSRAIASPCTIATRVSNLDELFTIRPGNGDEATLGNGGLRIHGVEFRLGRFLDYTAPRITDLLSFSNRFFEAAAGIEQRSELEPELLEALRVRPSDTLLQVLGKGSGLTPFGDDVVSAIVATFISANHSCATDLSRRVLELAPTRTTSLSATLLKRATHGEVLGEFARVISTCLHQPKELGASMVKLSSVGHTSGAAMLLGLHLALDHMRSCTA